MSYWVATLRRGLLAMLFVSCVGNSLARTWTSQNGRTIEAEFVRVHEEKVVLSWNGKVLQVPVSSLSEADQQFVNTLGAQGVAAGGTDKTDKNASSKAEPIVPSERAKRSDPSASASDGPRGIRREWTDIQGRKIVAKFVEAEGENIVLDRDGKIAKVPFQRLSTVDQHYVYKVLNDMGMPNNLPDVREEGDPTGALARDARERAAKEQAESVSPSGTASSDSGPQLWTPRVWTYTTGRRLTARLVTVQGSNVVLSFRNKPLDVPFSTLSGDDQQYVRDRLSERGQLALLAEIDGKIAAANQPPPPHFPAPAPPPSPPPAYASSPPSPPPFSHDPFGASRQRINEEHERRMQAAEERRQAMSDRMAQSRREAEERMNRWNTPSHHSPAAPSGPSGPYHGFASRPSLPPSYQPSSAPQQFESYQCRSCGKQMRAVPSDKKCPGCGVTFDRIENPDGTYTETGAKGSYRFSFRGAKGWLTLIGLVVAGLAALVRKVLD